MADVDHAARAATHAVQDGVEQVAETARPVLAGANETMSRSVAAWQAQGFEVPELFRAAAQAGVSQAREAYARLKDAAEDATDALEDSFKATRAGALTLQHKTLDAAERNSAATFDFARKLLDVTSVGDLVQLQTAFARERFEAFTAYAKDVQTTVAQASEDAVRPAMAVFAKTAGEAGATA